MSKSKKQTVSPLKIYIPIIVLVLLAIIIGTIVTTKSSETVYECTVFQETPLTTSEHVVTNDLLHDTYKSYKIVLKKNNIVSIDYVTNSDKSESLSGKYEIKDAENNLKTLTITLDDLDDFNQKEYEFKMTKDTITREKFISTSSYRGTIKQILKK